LNILWPFASILYRSYEGFDTAHKQKSYGIFTKIFPKQDAAAIKDIEKTTNHDVKRLNILSKKV
jgi:adenylosuccinate lyase